MAFTTGDLRHRIDIEQLTITQDSSGDAVKFWTALHSNVPASIEPLSARDFIAASAVQSQIVARITIRYRTGLDASMRINHNGTIYNISGILPDKDSGLEYLIMPVTAGVNEG